MSDDRELRRAARHLIDCHGASAVPVAEHRAVNMAHSGNEEAARIWRLIAHVVLCVQGAPEEAALPGP